MGGIVTRSLGLALSAVLLTVSTPFGAAAAQEIPRTWTLDTSVGVGGFVDPNDATIVDITISSQLLLVGRLDLNAGGTTVGQAIEVPAGGVKSLRLEGAPVRDRRLVAIRLFDTSGEDPVELETQQLRVTVPLRQIVVGLVGADAAEPALRSATPRPLDFDVELVRMADGDVVRGLGVLDYLVVGSSLSRLDSESLEDLFRWIEDGGVLVGSPGDVAPVVDAGGAEPWPGTSIAIERLDRGEVAVVSDLGAVSADEWSTLLRASSNPGLVRNASFEQGPGLLSAASAGREASVPGLPWLLAGIVAFVLLVGPVNFVVLRRFRRPDLGWLTVPVLSVVFVAGFWVAGRAQVADAAVTTASVVIDTGGDVSSTAAAVMQVSSGGERTLAFPDGWQITPGESLGFGFAAGIPDTDEPGRITFVLEDLGVGAAEARFRGGDPLGIEVDVGEAEEALVKNETDLTFWSWGVVVDGVGYRAGGDATELAPGEARTVSIPPRRQQTRYEPTILEVVQRTSFDPQFYDGTFQVLHALSYEADELARDLTRDGTYFFGFTDSLDTELSIDGRGLAAAGTTLVVKQFEVPLSLRASKPVRPTVVDVVGSATVEQHFNEIYAFGADSVWLHYEVPEEAVGTGAISPSFTRLRAVEVYDWSSGALVPYAWGDALDLAAVVSPGGDLVVKASPGDQNEFFDESLQLDSFQLDWRTA